MQYQFIEKKINYDGSQLKPLYAYTNFKIHGDSIISFIGSCDVTFEHMLDVEDLVENSAIKSDKMLHFIIEFFGPNLLAAVSLQRLFASIVSDILLSKGVTLVRQGDDLYHGEKKLSISIATSSVVSSMIHFAVNITNEGTPVKTCSLDDFGIEAKSFSEMTMKNFSVEYKSIVMATQKVKPI